MSISIPSDLCGRDLSQYLHKQSLFTTESTKAEYEIIKKICLLKIEDFIEDFDSGLKKQTIEVIYKNNLNESLNMTIRCKSIDILSVVSMGRESIERKKEASSLYLLLYEQTMNFDFLYRAVTIRNVKSLNSDPFLKEVISKLCGIEFAYHQELIIEALLKSYDYTKFSSISEFVQEAKMNSRAVNNLMDERRYLKIQKTLKQIKSNEYALEVSLSFEKEADNIQKGEELDFFYSAKRANYQHAYDELYAFSRIFKSEFERITRKLEECIKIAGLEMSLLPSFECMRMPDVRLERTNQKLQNCSITSFEDFFKELLKINMYSDCIDEYCKKKNIGNTGIGDYFNLLVLDKGYIEANPSSSNLNLVLAHKSMRNLVQYEIYSLFNYYIYSNISTNTIQISQYLTKINPIYIEDDCILLWALGISHALNNDLASSSYILLPLFERALRNLIKQETGTSRKLSKNIQTNYNLGDTLNRLNDFIDSSSLDELKYFLNDRSDVNFRNNLLHGHLVSNKIKYNGAYFLWICLKFIHLDGCSPYVLLR